MHTLRLEDAQDLVTGHRLDLAHTVAVTEQHTNLRWWDALLGILADDLCNLYIVRDVLN